MYHFVDAVKLEHLLEHAVTANIALDQGAPTNKLSMTADEASKTTPS